ncbi:hypothetical protein [Bacillus halotolerans]|uniref:hypothetical protein n=1 Tax=Bacillus halotolerans TaxID=260554 RepID=UPI001BD13BF5|nr:hypothetical protein [Bacillus halotolerans]MCM3353116.1 hypothetical protein [Bacillus halotolerans]QVN29347.1 hypothetical protein JYG31_09220 [Bacillus halotolerans]
MKLCEMEGFSENQPIAFIKFTAEKFAKELLDGKIYMKNCNFYRELEKSTCEKGRGDRFEGGHVVHINEPFDMYAEINGKEHLILSGDEVFVEEIYTGFKKTPIFCLFCLTAKDFKVRETIGKEGYVADIAVSKRLTNKMVDTFGEKAVVISAPMFIKRLIEYSDETNAVFISRLVKYVDFTKNQKERTAVARSNEIEPLFTKDKYFTDQKEYRFCFPNIQVEDSYEINIGSLSEFATIVDSKEVLSLGVINNKLNLKKVAE